MLCMSGCVGSFPSSCKQRVAAEVSSLTAHLFVACQVVQVPRKLRGAAGVSSSTSRFSVACQVQRTQTHGRGAEGADETAWAPSASAAQSAQPSTLPGSAPVSQQPSRCLGSRAPGRLQQQQEQQRPAPPLNGARHVMQPGMQGGPHPNTNMASQPCAASTSGPGSGAVGRLFPAPHQPPQQSRLRGQVHYPSSPAGSSHQPGPHPPLISPQSAQQPRAPGHPDRTTQQSRVLPASMRPPAHNASSRQHSSPSQAVGRPVQRTPPAQHGAPALRQLGSTSMPPPGSSSVAHALQSSQAPPAQGTVQQQLAGAAVQQAGPLQPHPARAMQVHIGAFGFLLEAGVIPIWLRQDLEEAERALQRMQVPTCHHASRRQTELEKHVESHNRTINLWRAGRARLG